MDRKQYLKEYHRKRWANDPQYRENCAKNQQHFKRNFLKEHSVPYQTHHRRQLKQEVLKLREERAKQ